MDPMEGSSSSGSSEDEDFQQEELEKEDSALDLIRKELSEVPFEDLHKLQERVGSKVYDKALFGSKEKASSSTTQQYSRRKKFKRANKNRPQEVTSKVPVSRFRNVIAVKESVRRDPRFDDLSGQYNEAAFNSNYSFMEGVRRRELTEVKNELKEAATEEKKEELLRLMQRMKQQEIERKQKQTEKEASTEHKKKEKELVKQGKKPFFLKKSEQKKVELANQYMKLKQSGKLDKHLARKRKKNATKDRKHLPNLHSQQT
ncbi:ribosomal RNA processing protein 36 homolog [Asterias amurensis]|uniref:ribosomal RNA processing protein 36 homolog n=1 Tax=Asterias amurensis TaxID=7602 RepID=UPI003AB7DC4C